MYVHQIPSSSILDRPEKLSWSEEGVHKLLCESNYIDMDNKDLNVKQLKH